MDVLSTCIIYHNSICKCVIYINTCSVHTGTRCGRPTIAHWPAGNDATKEACAESFPGVPRMQTLLTSFSFETICGNAPFLARLIFFSFAMLNYFN